MLLRRRRGTRHSTANLASALDSGREIDGDSGLGKWEALPSEDQVRDILLDAQRCLMAGESVNTGSSSSSSLVFEEHSEIRAWQDFVMACAKERLMSPQPILDSGATGGVFEDDSASAQQYQQQFLRPASRSSIACQSWDLGDTLEEVRRLHSEGEARAKLVLRHADEDAEQQARNCLTKAAQHRRKRSSCFSSSSPKSDVDFSRVASPLGDPGSLVGKHFGDTLDSWAWAPMKERRRSV